MAFVTVRYDGIIDESQMADVISAISKVVGKHFTPGRRGTAGTFEVFVEPYGDLSTSKYDFHVEIHVDPSAVPIVTNTLRKQIVGALDHELVKIYRKMELPDYDLHLMNDDSIVITSEPRQ